MSHVVVQKFVIKDLDALKRAAERLGLEFSNATTYKWYGRVMGDYPLPKGFTKYDIGNCQYKLSVKDNPLAYEVGIVKSKTVEGEWTLLFDFWAQGKGLMPIIGNGAENLNQMYQVEVLTRQLESEGYRVVEEYNEETQEYILTTI